MHTLLVIIMLIITTGRLSMIAQLNLALKRTAFVDSD